VTSPKCQPCQKREGHTFIESPLSARFSVVTLCKVALLLAAQLRSRFAVDDRSDEDQHILDRLSDYCGKPMLALNNTTSVENFKPYHWDYCNALLFVITVVTTVGTSHSCRKSVLMFYETVSDFQTVRGRGCRAVGLTKKFSICMKRYSCQGIIFCHFLLFRLSYKT
jgi:hypothetical protein